VPETPPRVNRSSATPQRQRVEAHGADSAGVRRQWAELSPKDFSFGIWPSSGDGTPTRDRARGDGSIPPIGSAKWEAHQKSPCWAIKLRASGFLAALSPRISSTAWPRCVEATFAIIDHLMLQSANRSRDRVARSNSRSRSRRDVGASVPFSISIFMPMVELATQYRCDGFDHRDPKFDQPPTVSRRRPTFATALASDHHPHRSARTR